MIPSTALVVTNANNANRLFSRSRSPPARHTAASTADPFFPGVRNCGSIKVSSTGASERATRSAIRRLLSTSCSRSPDRDRCLLYYSPGGCSTVAVSLCVYKCGRPGQFRLREEELGNKGILEEGDHEQTDGRSDAPPLILVPTP